MIGLVNRRPPDAAASPVSPTVHVPVLLREVLRGLELMPGLVVVDGTVGGAGHSARMLPTLSPAGRLIGLDRDPEMLDRARQVLPVDAVALHQASYVELPSVLANEGLTSVDRILVDLGLSSDQLADRTRGFSFLSDGPLDLRFNASEGMSAAEWLAEISLEELERVLREYGEEPHSRTIASALIRRRGEQPFRTARELADAVSAAVGSHGLRDKHPATRVFQAVRIAVNDELEHVRRALREVFPQCLKPGGLLAVIAFHSLEDRLVKDAFRDVTTWDVVTPKPVTASPNEERVNPRSRSAKLRIARRKA